MTTVVVGCDINSGNDSIVLNTVVSALKSAGYQTEKLSIGPGPFANYDWYGPSSGKIGVYLMAPSIVSIADAMSHKGFDKIVFGLRGDLGLRGTKEFTTAPWRPDSDCTSVCDKYSGKTGQQIKEMIEPRGTIVLGNTADEIAKNVVSAVGGKSVSSSTGTSQTGNGSQTTSNVSPLLQGEMTFEELVGEICNGIDLMFLCKRSTVVVTDFETIFAEAQYLREHNYAAVSAEDLHLWQLEDDSYELNINQHGFYNTVYVEYNKGKVKESFDDFVRVYGEVPITYKDKTVDKTTAQMKAKAYLAAHLRDLEMTVNATILSEPDIDIGDIVTLNNPKTMQNTYKKDKNMLPEYLFVKGVNTSWDGDGYIETDLEMQFSPTSPEKREVPTTGTKNCGTNSGSSVAANTGGWSEYGVSSDGTQIKAIGRPSSANESSYGYEFYESVFERKCPFCGSTELYWSIFWAGNETSNYGTFPATGASEGGSAEGHIFCKSCDADFSCILGADHTSPPRAKLKRISGPTKCTKADAYNLKKGMGATT